MRYRYIELERDGLAMHLWFSRPERRNALNHGMLGEIAHALDRVAADRVARALVLRGRGGVFCVGGNLGEMGKLPVRTRKGDPLAADYRRYGETFDRLNRLEKAVISVVEGPAVGGGLAMACCSDVVILHRSARIGMPEARAGFIPAQALPFVVRRLGEGTARYLAVTGAILDAREARAAGLGQFLCGTAASIDRAVRAVLRDIGRVEPAALATVKRLMPLYALRSQDAMLDLGSVQFARLLRRPQARAGMRAFLAKKPPPWAA